MSEDLARRLLQLVADEEGLSVARAAKKLGLGQSQLARLLALLGDSPVVGGLDCVQVRGEDPPRLYLTARAQALLGRSP